MDHHRLSHFLFFVFCLGSCVPAAHAQDVSDFRPAENHSAKSRDLINALDFQLRQEAYALRDSGNYQVVQRINEERIEALSRMIKNGAFIRNDSLESYVNTTLETIVRYNALADGQRRVLILDSPIINAYCFGQGIYIVSVSLLARIGNEHELAFTLAHELAHDLLGHVRERIVREAEVTLAKKSREQVRRILSGSIELEEIEEYRKLIYGVSKHSRQNEVQADSMAMLLLQNAGFDQEGALSMLTALDGSLKPKHDIGVDLFWPLNSRSFPLQEHWFNQRLSIYSRTFRDSYLYSVDSIETHPDIALRKMAISAYQRHGLESYDLQSPFLAGAVTVLAEFETVQSAYENAAFDRAIFYALQLLHRYPQNAFLVSRIGRMLITLYEARNNNDNTFRHFVPQYTSYYSEELRLINNMLHNLNTRELGEVAYYFLSDPARFNPEDKNHCYLVWKISELTYRRSEADEMRKRFREKFGSNIAAHSFY